MLLAHLYNTVTLQSQISEKDAEKMCVLRFDLNTCKVLDYVTFNGRLFHVFAAATGTAWSPITQCCIVGKASAEVKDECSCCCQNAEHNSGTRTRNEIKCNKIKSLVYKMQ